MKELSWRGSLNLWKCVKIVEYFLKKKKKKTFVRAKTDARGLLGLTLPLSIIVSELTKWALEYFYKPLPVNHTLPTKALSCKKEAIVLSCELS